MLRQPNENEPDDVLCVGEYYKKTFTNSFNHVRTTFNPSKVKCHTFLSWKWNVILKIFPKEVKDFIGESSTYFGCRNTRVKLYSDEIPNSCSTCQIIKKPQRCFNVHPGADLDHVTYDLWRTKILPNCSKSFKIVKVLLLILILTGADLDHITYGLWSTKILTNCIKSFKIVEVLILIFIQI